jgi:ParB family chromosome partitioning protein
MAREAAHLLEGSNWLPEPPRNPDDAVSDVDVPAGTAADAEAEEADLPVFFAEEAGVTEPIVEAAE